MSKEYIYVLTVETSSVRAKLSNYTSDSMASLKATTIALCHYQPSCLAAQTMLGTPRATPDPLSNDMEFKEWALQFAW